MAIFFALPGNEHLASNLASLTRGEIGQLELRRFPDGETYVRISTEVSRKDVFVVCTLARPDEQFIPIAFVSAAILEHGAQRLQLIAPYLPYMRQDRIFHAGEVLTSRIFAELLQQHFHGLITVDPHLHRHRSLDEVYDIPSTIIHAAPLLASWICDNVPDPVVIGPDAESTQWVESIAKSAAAPWTVFAKERKGDRRIVMKAPGIEQFRGRTPVLVDDIISSGSTVRMALQILKTHNLGSAYCLAVHGLCTDRAARQIRDRTLGFFTTNSVANRNAALDVAPLIAASLISAAANRAE